MKKECAEIEKLIDKVIDGEASAEEHGRVEAHARQCERCRVSLRSGEKIAQSIAALRRPRIPNGFASRVTNRIDAGEESIGKENPLVKSLLAAAAVCLLFGTLWVLFYARPDVPKPDFTEVHPEPTATLLAECTEGARLVADGAGAGLFAVLSESGKAAEGIFDAALEGFTLFDSGAHIKGRPRMDKKLKKLRNSINSL